MSTQQLQEMQEVFDTVAAHLLKQGQKSLDFKFTTSCRYRGPNGLKCGIGALIKDEFYLRDMEGRKADHKIIIKAVQDSGFLKETLDNESVRLLERLQEIHDQLQPGEWKSALKRTALRFGLSPQVLDR